MGPIIISVIGAPGIGKSFLVKKLAKKLEAIPILEDSNEFPDRIIENFKNNSRLLETILWFINKRIEDIKKSIELKNNGKIIVIDTCFITSELHIITLAEGFEQEILLKLAQFDREFIPKPDIIVFLDASEDTIRKFTKKRGRDYDTNEAYIQRNLSIKRAHEEYYNENKDSLIYVNRDKLDFKKEEDLQKVIEKINKKIH